MTDLRYCPNLTLIQSTSLMNVINIVVLMFGIVVASSSWSSSFEQKRPLSRNETFFLARLSEGENPSKRKGRNDQVE